MTGRNGRWRLMLTVLTASVSLAGCSKPEPKASPAGGCGSDRDCKGDRICEQGRCVTPAPTPTQAKDAEQETSPTPERPPPPVVTTPPPPPPVETVVAVPPSLGATEPLVVITEFGDFRCPYCERARTVLRALIEKHGKADGVLRVEWRHNPLDSHPQARRLAEVATAAHAQGRFWHVHDELFNNRDAVSKAQVDRHLQQAGVDMTRFRSAMEHPAVAERVSADRAIATALGVVGTPAFFVNGRLLAGYQSVDAMEAVIAEEVAAARKALQSGLARADVVARRQRANNPEFARYVLDGAKPEPVARPTLPVDNTIWKVSLRGDEPTRGPADALVTIVEFADFECPFCARYAPVLKSLVEAHNDVRVVFKHNPLPVHRKATPAANAAIAAHQSGSFWAFHDALFAAPGALAIDDLRAAAEAAKIPVELIENAATTLPHAKVVEADQALAAQVGAIGTPNLFINGRKVVGLRPLEQLEGLIAEARTDAAARVKSGVAKAELYAALIADGQSAKTLEASPGTFDLTDAPTRGVADAPIQVVFVGDFQCPFSSRLVPILERVLTRFDGKVRLAFKHAPGGHHPRAETAAAWAECARQKDRFWEFYAELFDLAQQRDLSDAALTRYAQKAGLDPAAMSTCASSEAVRAHIAKDAAEAKARGVKGTPTVFINDRRFDSPIGYNDRAFAQVFQKLLETK